MIALDYIIIGKKIAKIPKRLVPALLKLVEFSIVQKYESAKFDSELLDLIELADCVNGGSK